MTTKNLGRIRMNPKGVYDPLLAYDRLDLVTLAKRRGNVPRLRRSTTMGAFITSLASGLLNIARH